MPSLSYFFTILSDYKYDGALNFLVLEQEMSVVFACNFDLMMYPFDQQVCYLNFEIQDLNIKFGVLEKVWNAEGKLNERLCVQYLIYIHFLCLIESIHSPTTC